MLEGHHVFLRPKQAAEALNISQRTLRNWLRQGLIPYRKIGRVVLIPRKALEDWANGDMLENADKGNTSPGRSGGNGNNKW